MDSPAYIGQNNHMARKALSKPHTGWPSPAAIDFGVKLYPTASKRRNQVDSVAPELNGDRKPQSIRSADEGSQYQHAVRGLIFLSRADPHRSSASVTLRASSGEQVKWIGDSFDVEGAKRLASGSMSSHQLGVDDLILTLIEADPVDISLRDSAFPQCEATPQVLSTGKNNMVALPAQPTYSTHLPVYQWFIAKNKTSTPNTASSTAERRTINWNWQHEGVCHCIQYGKHQAGTH